MNPGSLLTPSNRRVGLVALLVLISDQLTKALVLRFLGYEQEKVVIDGFFKLVYWGNTGAAWSLFRGNNGALAIVAIAALFILFLNRKHFDSGTALSQIAFGLIIGGVIGNLIDRIRVHHVIDFLYFYLERTGRPPLDFPAFNVADTAICTGVGLIFLRAWRHEAKAKPAGTPPSKSDGDVRV